MPRARLLGAAVALVSATACAHLSGSEPSWKTELRDAEVRRDAFAPAVTDALRAGDVERRKAGLWALGRIEEVGTASLAVPLLTDPSPAVATAAAFTLGQLQDPVGVKAMQAALPSSQVPAAVLRGLARAGTASVAADVAARLEDPNPEVRGAAALSLGLLQKRWRDLDPGYAERLSPLVSDAAPAVRYGATYALARFSGPEAAVGLVPALRDADPEVRMWAAIGLGASGANPGVLDVVMRDTDWRVRAAAARALGDMASKSPTEAGRAVTRLDALASRAFARVIQGDRLVAGRALHVLFAAVEAAVEAGAPGRRVLDKLEQATWETENLPASAGQDLARVQCAAAAALDRIEKVAKRIETCGKGTFDENRRRQVWLQLRANQGGEGAVAAIAPFARNPDPSLRTAAVLALSELKTPASNEALFALLDSNDPSVVSGAIEILADPARASLRPPALGERLFDTLDRLVAQPDDSVVVGPIDAIANLEDAARPLLGRLRKLGNDPRPAVRRRAGLAQEKLTGARPPMGPGPAEAHPRPPAWPRAFDIVLETERGRIVLSVDGGRAPRQAGNLRALVRAGFYDGRPFHRVVTTFVTQGGCPRGDGWGGPGYTVPAELSAARFERGAVGIATNGRDTGGSQFFFMHAYHPHLDGRYPWVGRILEGIDVADALQIDDRILRASVR